MIVHRGIPRQRGRGGGYLGRWMRPYHHQTGRGFKDMAKAAIKTLGPKVLKSAFQVGMDLMHGKPIKNSLMLRGRQLAYDVSKNPFGLKKVYQKHMRQAVVDRTRRQKRRRVPPPPPPSRRRVPPPLPPSASRRIHKSRVKRSRPQLQRGRGRRRSSVKRILRRGLRKLRKNNRIIKRTIDIFD